MTIIKQYVTWQRLFAGKNIGTDISANINNNWDYEGRKITCTELSYGNVDTDKRLLAIVSYDDSQYDKVDIEKMYSSVASWVATKITPTKAVELCNKWYPSPEGEDDYFSLDSDDFTIVDDRPVDPLDE